MEGRGKKKRETAEWADREHRSAACDLRVFLLEMLHEACKDGSRVVVRRDLQWKPKT